ncbi:hypothetical protein ACFPM0_28590 [Pseudonocardia sulfidoxydans]|uniref:hypothetical protein n=1 Tax=Pseudonocardia sulfidoxydans TaxID=54011 RepID=UPI00360D4431
MTRSSRYGGDNHIRRDTRRIAPGTVPGPRFGVHPGTARPSDAPHLASSEGGRTQTDGPRV